MHIRTHGHAIIESRMVAANSRSLGSASVSEAKAIDKISSFKGSKYSINRCDCQLVFLLIRAEILATISNPASLRSINLFSCL